MRTKGKPKGYNEQQLVRAAFKRFQEKHGLPPNSRKRRKNNEPETSRNQ